MNDLQKILKEAEDLGLEVEWQSDDGKTIQLIDKRSYDWLVVFEITAENCNVVEYNYDNAQPEQSNETVPTFEEALSMAGEWC